MKVYHVLIFCLLFTSCKKKTLFETISSNYSGVHFTNLITENDTINPLDMVNIYNGGGVGIGDFNQDGWSDIYFVGNRVSSKLYLNKGAQPGGEFTFEDVTGRAGVTGEGRWGRGVAVVDINNDGWPDIYVCNTLAKDSLQRRNLLYVNQKLTKEGIPVFREMSADYGLAINVQSTMANFFDYDNDGDLDMYLTVNEASPDQNPNQFGLTKFNGRRSTGRLFRNDFNSAKKHAQYSDVSAQAGMNLDGFGHSATVVDINLDGWKDISVANDFLSSNILYINNKNGGSGQPTFTDHARDYFKHTSLNAMGQDIGDINNDGLADLVELDMNPEDNYRKKMMMMANNYVSYLNFDLYGYQYQYVRNTLQLNQGPRVGAGDSLGAPAFSEIGFMSGVAQTDWSWTPLLTDFTNDGFRDLIITNGFPKDVTDHDFMAYRDAPTEATTKAQLLAQIPVVKIHNYAYENTGDLTFRDATTDWGFSEPTFSNGAVYADLNNDGALDVVINNINDEALIYRNTARTVMPQKTHFLQVKLTGDSLNRDGFGAFVSVFYKGKKQVYEHTPYRGYLSTNQAIAHFGLGPVTVVDSVVVRWPNGKKQVLPTVYTDQVLRVSSRDATVPYSWAAPTRANALFRDVTAKTGLTYRHKEFDFIDFNIQKLLPHKLSEYSPGLAVGDVNGDGTDDLIVGGNAHDPAQLFLQKSNGTFTQQNALPTAQTPGDYKDEGLLLFDANGDGRLDLYIARGGYKQAPNSPTYQDKLYLNDGNGPHFTEATNALPANLTSKFCVRALDYNRDGRLDLFVSGRVDPWHYPRPVSSFILRNDSQNGRTTFTDVTAEIAPALRNIGLTCDALVTDFDNDTWPDLILAGEWMPITLLKNTNGHFAPLTVPGLSDKPGWWNSIVAGDFRHTGRMDYIVGNAGLNTLFQASEQYPVYITAGDFDNSGNYSAIPSLFLPDATGAKKEFTVHGREDLIKQMNGLKRTFADYKSFANATINEVLAPEQRQKALRLKATMLQSCFLRNDSNGMFTLIPLPKAAQVSTLNGMVVDDYNGDGHLDVAITGNDYGTDVAIGRYDALNGLLLTGDGRGHFSPQAIRQSGLYIPSNGKALVKLRTAQGGYSLIASQNRDVLKVFALNHPAKTISLAPDDMSALVRYKNGQITRQEFPYGSSFLSQSARFLAVDTSMVSVELMTSTGQRRLIKPGN